MNDHDDLDPHYWDLIESDYQPGDMAHPYEPTHFDFRKAVTDPDHWVIAFMLAVVWWVTLVAIFDHP